MSFPASPVLNEVFIADGKAWKFDGINWVIPKRENTLPWELVTGKPTYFPSDWSSTVANRPDYFNAKVISSAMPPTNQVEGTLWWDETNKRLYVWQLGVWLETSAAVRGKYISVDPDVINYIEAVEAADGEPLEPAVVTELEAFILGCKIDGIWDSISASCIIAGARTLAAAATTPLRGPTPTLVTSAAFNESNYNRKTGVDGGSTAYQGIATNYNNNNENYLNFHHSVYVTQGLTTNVTSANLSFWQPSGTVSATGQIMHGPSSTGDLLVIGCTSGIPIASILPNSTTGFIGATRGVNAVSTSQTASTPSTHWMYRGNGTDYDVAATAINNMHSGMVLKRFTGGAGYPPAEPRASFYSVGSSIDLALLDNRVTKLMTKLNTILP